MTTEDISKILFTKNLSFIEDEGKETESKETIYLTDILFPFHMIFPLYSYTFSSDNEEKPLSARLFSIKHHYLKSRHDLLRLLNRNHSKFLEENDRKRLVFIEKKYFFSCLFTYGLAFYTAYTSRIQLNRSSMMRIYLILSLISMSKCLGILYIKKEIDYIKYKFNVKSIQILSEIEKINDYDLLDETLVPDYRCYLYYLNLI